MAKKKKEKLSVYLLKDTIKDYKEALRSDVTKTYKLKSSVNNKGVVVVKSLPNEDGPNWQNLVSQTIDGDFERLTSKSNSAIIFIETSGRIFAFAFGYGNSLLDPSTIEDRFGLIVTINRVNADQLKSVDIKNYESTQFQVRKQAAGITGLDTFGLDIRRDILSAVAGIPSNNKIGFLLAGRDSLSILTDKNVNQLKELCKELLTAYNEDKYKERFGWIDQLKLVKDKITKDELNQSLVDDINSINIDNIELTQPEIFDPLRISGYKYHYSTDGDLELVLDIESYLSNLPKEEKPLTVEYLKGHHISYYYEDDTTASGNWTIFKCLACQKEYKGTTYVLNAGDWFEISDDLVKDVDGYVKTIGKSNLPFPENIWGDEGAYNESAAKILPDTLLQDKQLIRIGGPHGSIEPCDLLTKPNYIIHVKRKTHSATLSHLYAQAQVSADLLRADRKFKTEWRKNIRKADASFCDVIKDIAFKRDSYEIVLAILTSRPADIPRKLPFFARLHLMHIAQQLRDYGYKVTIAGILEKPNHKTKKKPSKK